MSQVGQRISEQRSAYGFSTAELARLAQLEEPRVIELEHGAAATLYELTSVARALAVDPKVLLEPIEAPDAKRSVARFRAPLGVSSISGHDMRLLAKAAEIGRVSAHLLQELDHRESPIVAARRVMPVRGRPEPWRQGYELGERAREGLLPGGKPIESVQACFEGLDIHVAIVKFESEDIEAASLYEPGASPIVLLSELSERVRREISRRAILAHELCHLLHDAGERDLLASISREHDHAPVEMRANGFAPSFLAPKAHVLPVGTTPREVVKNLAYTWGFTLEGAVWHAKNLKLISQDDATELVNERRTATLQPSFERPVRRLPVDTILESTEVSLLTNGLVSDLTVRALADGIISRGRAREILTMR